MCSAYWNLMVELTCPSCGEKGEWELQTHWMGEVGSCLNRYRLGEKVQELAGIMSAAMDGANDSFISNCPSCKQYFDFGGAVKDEAVESVYVLQRITG